MRTNRKLYVLVDPLHATDPTDNTVYPLHYPDPTDNISVALSGSVACNGFTFQLCLPIMISIKHFLIKDHSGKTFFFLAWLILILFYYPARNAMLIDDGINAIFDIQQQGSKGIVNSYGFDSFYHGYFIILNILYKLFNLNSTAWFLFFSAMHALNVTLLYKMLSRVLASNGCAEQAQKIAFCAAFLFLLSPYSAENIVWAATAHYVVGLAILIFSMYWLDGFFKNEYSFKGYLFFLFANVFYLLTFELSFLSPIVYVSLFSFYAINRSARISFQKFLLRLILPLGFSILLYFIFLYIHKGTFIPHNGKGSQLFSSLPETISQLGKYFLKLFSFVHFADVRHRDLFYSACEKWYLVLIVLCLIFSLMFYIVKRKNGSLPAMILFIAFGILFLIPFTRTYFAFVFKYENLRYLYFASAFLFSSFVYFLFHLHAYIRYPILVVFAGLSVYFMIQTVNDKQQSANVYHRFIQHFPDVTKKKVYLLNTPTWCNESYMFWDRSRLPIALFCYRGMETSGRLEQILFYNSMSDKDTFSVKRVDDSSWSFQLTANGSWLMNEYMGAASYENNTYRCEVGEWGSFMLRFKRRLYENEAVYYFNGSRFVKLR